MIQNYYNLKIGCPLKKVTIENLEIRRPMGRNKLYLKVTDGQRSFTVNEIWCKDDNKPTQGLWMDFDQDGQIFATSDLARLLASLDISSIGELIGKVITVKPKNNGFLCVKIGA